MSEHIHIVSLNIPYPADYGGVIDIFYKIKALKKEKIKITLHCFQYGREKSKEIDELCDQVYYYRRKTGFLSHLSILPYIIRSRRSKELLENLNKDHDPVFFEGLHTTYYIKHNSLRDRIKIVRTHNIEHVYYFKLFRSTVNPGSKFFFLVESLKLFLSEKRLKKADAVAAISEKEYRYFDNKYKNAFLLNPFHSNDRVEIKPGKGDYILYHGNLSVPENAKAVRYLLGKVIPEIDFPFIIAGKRPSLDLIDRIKSHKKVKLVASPSYNEMEELIQNAHAIIIISFQDTGIKLKLIESLFLGRHCIINDIVSGDSGLGELCETGNSPMEIIIQIKKILGTGFDESLVEMRKRFLSNYENKQNAMILITNIFNRDQPR